MTQQTLKRALAPGKPSHASCTPMRRWTWLSVDSEVDGDRDELLRIYLKYDDGNRHSVPHGDPKWQEPTTPLCEKTRKRAYSASLSGGCKWPSRGEAGLAQAFILPYFLVDGPED